MVYGVKAECDNIANSGLNGVGSEGMVALADIDVGCLRYTTCGGWGGGSTRLTCHGDKALRECHGRKGQDGGQQARYSSPLGQHL